MCRLVRAGRRPKPQNRANAGAAEATVTHLDAAGEGTQDVERNEFKQQLKQAIADATPQPKSEDEAERVMQTGAADADQRSQRHRPNSAMMRWPTPLGRRAEVSPESQPADTQTSLSPEPLGEPPAPVSAAPVVPEPLPPERLDYSSDRAQLTR